MQNKTKGRIFISALILVSGFIGGALGVLFGRTDFEVVLIAAGFGVVSYLLLVALAIVMMYTSIKMIERLNNEH